MKALILALEIRKKYNQMDIRDVVKEFEEYTNQKVPEAAIRGFTYTGLNNVDFLTSEWLNDFGLKNLVEKQ